MIIIHNIKSNREHEWVYSINERKTFKVRVGRNVDAGGRALALWYRRSGLCRVMLS